MQTIHFASELFDRRNMLESASFMLIGSVYFFLALLLRSMDENDDVAATRSRISLISSRVTLGPGLGSGSVAAMTRSTQDAKSMPSLVLQLRKSFIRVDPRHC